MAAVIFRDEAIGNAREFVDRLKFRAPGIYRSILIEASEVLERIEQSKADVMKEIFQLDDLLREAKYRKPCAEWDDTIDEATKIVKALKYAI